MAIFNSKLLNYQRVSITVRDYHILDQIPILVGLILFVSPKKKSIALGRKGSPDVAHDHSVGGLRFLALGRPFRFTMDLARAFPWGLVTFDCCIFGPLLWLCSSDKTSELMEAGTSQQRGFQCTSLASAVGAWRNTEPSSTYESHSCPKGPIWNENRPSQASLQWICQAHWSSMNIQVSHFWTSDWAVAFSIIFFSRWQVAASECVKLCSPECSTQVAVNGKQISSECAEMNSGWSDWMDTLLMWLTQHKPKP